MAHKLKLEISGSVIENMSGFVTPDGERYDIFGSGGGQALASDLGVPLLARVPLTMKLREQADSGTPVVFAAPDDPAAQAIRAGAREIIARSPAAPIELPLLEVTPAAAPAPVRAAGMSLPMA